MVVDLFKMFNKEDASKDVAKERLRMLLVHDRANVSPQFMEIMKDELVSVISNYMEIDKNNMQMSITSGENSVALMANIPIKKMKRNVNVGK